MADGIDMKEIDLKMSGENSQATTKKLIYCSDGQLDEDELQGEDDDLVDNWDFLEMLTLEGAPSEMNWAKWAAYKAGRGLGHTLKTLEGWGEWLANEFGITEPLYQDIIDMHKRTMEDAGEPITGKPELLEQAVRTEPAQRMKQDPSHC